MKLLHTSDWHLGHKLYGRQRYEEFANFLQWLEKCIEKHGVETLIVAGDIFDSQTPSNRSLAMYYGFLSRISHSCCRHIIIIGGNHDSPTLLNAPRELLHFLNIHVVGSVPVNIEDELIVLHDKNHDPEALILAIPYLRDKDIRSSTSQETPDDKHIKMLQGIRDHYSTLVKLAREKQKQINKKIPLIATGHLFCQGGVTGQGDGVRELYVGTLVRVGLDCFPNEIDYLALGHLHLPQLVAKQENRRYSGSPLTMNFSEACEQKAVLLVEISEEVNVQEIPVPCFQQLQTISGDLEYILQTIENLGGKKQSILLEIHYKGETLIDDLQEQIISAVEETELEVLRISNKRIYNYTLRQTSEIKTLDELSPHQVFQQCLDLSEIPYEQQQEMTLDFKTALSALSHSEEKA
ncbi:MAG TPA: exonuclease subunit SbcD [Desulfocapsa sulfexigens]|nr:exonuclease subunit SbcD [Desulfocapsa sulfexigens]